MSYPYPPQQPPPKAGTEPEQQGPRRRVRRDRDVHQHGPDSGPRTDRRHLAVHRRADHLVPDRPVRDPGGGPQRTPAELPAGRSRLERQPVPAGPGPGWPGTAQLRARSRTPGQRQPLIRWRSRRRRPLGPGRCALGTTATPGAPAGTCPETPDADQVSTWESTPADPVADDPEPKSDNKNT